MAAAANRLQVSEQVLVGKGYERTSLIIFHLLCSFKGLQFNHVRSNYVDIDVSKKV